MKKLYLSFISIIIVVGIVLVPTNSYCTVQGNRLEIYYVWIPRYQYALNQTSQRSNVKFIRETGTETLPGYKIPDAFWFDKNNDGIEQEDERLTGYWVSKYELSE